MTLEHVARRIARMRARVAELDFDHATALEAELHDDVVLAMEVGSADVEHARLALTTLNVDFPRRGQ
jgi:hypothetical protein